MKKLLLILGLSLGLATSASAWTKGKLHPNPNEVLSKGKVISQGFEGHTSQMVVILNGEVYGCRLNYSEGVHACRLSKPKLPK